MGDQVQSYNPSAKTVSTQTVQQVFINHDTDLIDVTLAVQPVGKQTKPQQVAVVSHGSHAPPVTTEVVHTTQKHPWLTTQGWMTAGQLQLGDQVQQLDGATATVVGLKIIVGTASMYDLTVSNVHTFAVGDGQFVVHNCSVEASQAKSLAVDARDAMVKKSGFWFKIEATIGVATMRDAEGDVQTFATLNEGALKKWGGDVSSLLKDQGAEWLEGNPDGKTHAEMVLWNFAQNTGREILGIGPSNGYCSVCKLFLQQNLGEDFMG